MIVTLVTVSVIPDFVDDFVAVTIANHEGSIREEGNLRFDVLRRSDDPTVFTLYEAYASEEAAAAHKETAHYQKWREAVAPWMAAPREGVRHEVVRPLEESLW